MGLLFGTLCCSCLVFWAMDLLARDPPCPRPPCAGCPVVLCGVSLLCCSKFSWVRPKFGRSPRLPSPDSPSSLRRTPLRWTAQNFALFFRSPATMFTLSSSLGSRFVDFWWCDWRLWGPRGFTPENSKRAHLRVPAFSHTTKSPRNDPQERKKEWTLWRESEKKTRNFGPPPFGVPTLRGPHPSGHQPSGTRKKNLEHNRTKFTPHLLALTVSGLLFVVCAALDFCWLLLLFLLLVLLLVLVAALGRRASNPPPLSPLQCLTFQNVNNNFSQPLETKFAGIPPNFHGKTLLLSSPPSTLRGPKPLGLNCSGFGPPAFGLPCSCCCVQNTPLPLLTFQNVCTAFVAFNAVLVIFCCCLMLAFLVVCCFSCCTCCFCCRFCGLLFFMVLLLLLLPMFLLLSLLLLLVDALFLLLLRVLSGRRPLKSQSVPAFDLPKCFCCFLCYLCCCVAAVWYYFAACCLCFSCCCCCFFFFFFVSACTVLLFLLFVLL